MSRVTGWAPATVTLGCYYFQSQDGSHMALDPSVGRHCLDMEPEQQGQQ